MSSPFSSMLLLKAPVKIDANALEQAIRAVAGPFVQTLTIHPAEDGHPSLVVLNDVTTGVLNISAPAPGFSTYESDGPNLLWPSVEADLAQHKAHISVVAGGEANSREAALGLASVVTFISAALLRLAQGIGVYWPEGENFVTAETFLGAAEGYGRGEGPPVMAWLRLYAEQDKAGIVVSTHGLKHFAGREIDVAPSQKSLGDVLSNVLAISSHLIQSGVVFKQGETVGPENEATFGIALKDSGRLKDGPVYVLAPPKAPLGKKKN